MKDFTYLRYFPSTDIGIMGNLWTGGLYITPQTCVWLMDTDTYAKGFACSRKLVKKILWFFQRCCYKCSIICKQKTHNHLSSPPAAKTLENEFHLERLCQYCTFVIQEQPVLFFILVLSCYPGGYVHSKNQS